MAVLQGDRARVLLSEEENTGVCEGSPLSAPRHATRVCVCVGGGGALGCVCVCVCFNMLHACMPHAALEEILEANGLTRDQLHNSTDQVIHIEMFLHQYPAVRSSSHLDQPLGHHA